MSELERILYRELYRKSFYEFVKAFWNTADPSKFVDGKLVQCYCEIFQYMCKEWVGYTDIKIDLPKASSDIEIIDIRQNKHNLCLMVPPRHSKSIIFNVFGPVWLWLSHPIKAVSISHTGALAGQMNSKRYAIINSEKFKYFFDDIVLQTNSANFLKDTRGGELYSLNRNAFTGYGGDVIINDDLTNAETARKDQAEMANAWNYYQNTMPSRINDINKCIIMNIQQRLAPNDIAGHIMSDTKLAATYAFVTLPAQFSKHTYIVCPISGILIEYKVGEYLWPERFGDYSALRYQVGETIFQTQYLQQPIASDRTVVKPYMIVEADLPDTPGIENADIVYASHDFPVKDKDTSDYLGSSLGYRVGATLYLTDCLEKRMAFVKSVEYVQNLDNAYPGIIQIIEDKANGSPIMQQLQDKVAGLQAYQPGTASKMQRLESSTLYMEARNVIFVRNYFNNETKRWELNEGLKNLKERLLNFPFVEHDDIIDSADMMILFVFMDRRYMVYGRSFNEKNIAKVSSLQSITSETVFFNHEGDIWKALKIGMIYSEHSQLVILDEIRFTANIDDGLRKLKEFGANCHVAIDSSVDTAFYGAYPNINLSIERYEIADFDKSVAALNLAFANKQILIDSECKLTKVDIEGFKFRKTKDDTAEYVTTRDGFVACIRTAITYFGGIN